LILNQLTQKKDASASFFFARRKKIIDFYLKLSKNVTFAA